LDEVDERACDEGKKEWNQGACPWILKSVRTFPGVLEALKGLSLSGDDTESTDSEESMDFGEEDIVGVDLNT
jgi:hypothetical protein